MQKYQGYKRRKGKQEPRQDHTRNGDPNLDRSQRDPASWLQRQGDVRGEDILI
jgi:hypothetical protein